MKYIKHFLKFKESYVINQTDSPIVVAAKQKMNELKFFISEYSKEKDTLKSIFVNYTNDEDLKNKLKSKKYTDENGSIKNPLLLLFSKIAQNQRKIDDYNVFIETYTDDIKQKEALMRETPSLKETLTDDIQKIKEKLNNKKTQISKLISDISNIETEIKDKIKDFETEIKKSEENLKN